MSTYLIVLLVIVDFALLANVLLPERRPVHHYQSRFAVIPETYQTVDTETIWVAEHEIERVKATRKVLSSGPSAGGYWVTVEAHRE